MSKNRPFDDRKLREEIANHLAQKKNSEPKSSQPSGTGGIEPSTPSANPEVQSAGDPLSWAAPTERPVVAGGMPFNFAEQSDPEVAAEEAAKRQRQSDRLSQIQSVYDTAQGSGSSKDIQDIKPTNGEIKTEGDRKGNRAAYVYNKFLNGIGSLASAVGDIGATVMASSPNVGYSYNADNQVEPRTPEEINKQKEILTNYRKDTAGKVRDWLTDQIGADVDDGRTAKYDNEFLTSSIGGLAESIPAMALPAPIRTAGFILQGYDSSLRSLNANDQNNEIDDLTKTIYATTVGTVSGLLEKVGFDKIMGPGTSRVAEGLTNKIVREAAEETGGKVTADVLTRIMNTNVREFAERYAKRGVNAAEGFLIEAATGGSQEAATIASEYLLNKSTGKPIFDVKDMSTWDGFVDNVKRVAYAAAQEGVGGGLIRGVLHPTSRKQFESEQETLDSISDELENPNLSEATKQVLVQRKIDLQNSIDSKIREANTNYDKLNDDQKKQISEIGDRLDGINQSLEDPNLSDDVKSDLQRQSNDLVKEMEAIIPEQATVTVKVGADVTSGDTIELVNGKRGQVQNVEGEQISIKMDDGTILTTNPTLVELNKVVAKENPLKEGPAKPVATEEPDKAANPTQEEQSRIIDETVSEFQKKFPDKVPDLMEDIPESVAKTFERVEADTPTDLTAINETSDWLYNKYKQLTAMKKSDSRLATTEQINQVQDQLEKDITTLENHKAKYFNDKTSESTIEEQGNVVDVEKAVPTSKEKINEEVPKKAKENIYIKNEVGETIDVDPSKIELAFDSKSGSDGQWKNNGEANKFVVKSGDSEIGEVILRQNGDNVTSSLVEIYNPDPANDSNLNKGLGQNIYKKIGEYVRDVQGKTLISETSENRNDLSTNAWKSLVKKGLAVEQKDSSGNIYYEYGEGKSNQQIEQNKSRTIEDIKADEEALVSKYRDALKDAGLFELASEGKAPADQIAAIRDQVQKDFGKTRVELKNEREALESIVPKSEIKTTSLRDVLQEIEKQPSDIAITVDSDNKIEQTKEEIINMIKSTLDKTKLPYKDIVSNEKGSGYNVITNDGTEIEVLKLLKMGNKMLTPKLTKANLINHLIKTEPNILREIYGDNSVNKVVEEKTSESPVKEKPVKEKPKREEPLSEDEVNRKKELGAKFRGRFNDITGVFTTVFDKEFREYAGLVLKEAKGDFVNFSKDIIDSVGEKIREHLPKLYKELGGVDPVGEMEVDPTLEPEVISEIEKSPEDISKENVQEFKKRLDKQLKSAAMTTLIKTGVVKSNIAMEAVQKVAEIEDHKTMLAAGRAVKKVFRDVIRNAYLSQVKKAKEGLAARLKNSKLAKTDVIKSFMKLKEINLDIIDLERYNILARTLNDQYNARLEGVVADADLQKFLDSVADKKAKAILDEQVSESAHELGLELIKEPTESPRRKQLNAAVEINRQEVRKGNYDPAYKKVASALLNINTENMSNRELVDLNMALINLGVNDRLVSHEQIFKDYTGETAFKAIKERVGDNIRGLLENMLGAAARSLDVNSKIIFKGINDSSKFQSESGVAGISNGNSQVANIDMKGLEKNYKSFIDQIKFPEYNTADNRFLRGLYSAVTQFNSIDSEAKDFDRYKSLVKQSYEKLLTSKKPSEQREGQLREQQYQEYLAPFEDKQSFEDNFLNKQPKNLKVVDFFRDQFADKLPEMKLNTLIYGGKNLKTVNNYLPMAWKRYSGTEIQAETDMQDIVNPIYDFDPETGDVSERQSSTTIERTNKNKIKDTDRVLNMDFDRFIFDKYREMNYDIRTLKDRHLYNSIRSQEGFGKFVGSAENAKVLTDGVRDMVKRQMGQGYTNTPVKPLVDAARLLSAKGVRQALFGVSQVIKQYPSVAVRTMINLNSDVGLFFKGINVGKDNPIFDNFGVGLRGSTKGGTNFELELNNIAKSDFSSTPAKLLSAVNKASKAAADKLAKPLSWSDEAVAKHSWIAYYLQHIKQNGGDISKIDWATEHLNPNNEAGAYADLMVSTTQAPNDPSKGASLLYDQGDAKTIVRDVIAPFTSFARNSQANLEADLRTFAGGTTAEKKAAAWGIISNISEQVAFNSIKVLAVATMINSGSKFIQGLFGNEPEDKKEQEDPASKIMKNSAADILFSGLGQSASYLAIKGVNQVNKAIQGTSKDLFFQYNPAKYGEPDFGIAGIYGILPQNVYNTLQKMDYVDGTLTDTYSQKGKDMKSTVNLKPKDQALVSALFFMDALAIAGLSDAELSRMNQTIFRDIKKRTAPVKKFTVESANKKAGAIKEEIIP